MIRAEPDLYPWGGELQFTNSDPNHYKFTGKERDTETGLDYFGTRYYSNGLGRWVSADWSATPIPVPYADFGDPQSLNLYGYVGNNPLSRADADGHCCSWDDVQQFGSGFADASYRPFVQAVSHPIDTAAGLGSAIAHPINTGTAVVNAVIDTGKAALSGDPKAIGQVAGTVATTLATAGAAKAVGAALEGAEVGETAADAAAALSKETGANSAAYSTDSVRGRIDLTGKAHFDKATGESISTPHVHERPVSVGPNGKTNLGPQTTRPATTADIDKARSIIKDKQ